MIMESQHFLETVLNTVKHLLFLEHAIPLLKLKKFLNILFI